jgi:alpha-tubulin suppressor-like RCC1 family protein
MFVIACDGDAAARLADTQCMKCVVVASLALTGCGLYFGSSNPSPPTPGGEAKLLVAGSRSTCARVGTAWWCWGANYADQITDLPEYDPRAKFSPERILPMGTVLAMGGSHSCSVEAMGVVNCWGSNWSGQLGRVTDPPSVNAEHNLPAPVDGLPRKATFVATGGNHTCAILDDRSLWCWGDNTRGQLGVDVSSGPTPRHVLDAVAAVALGDAHSCAALSDQSVSCWGANDRGQLGDGTLDDQPAPTAIGVTAVALALGHAHTCALDSTGAATCWGANDRGQLGDGTTTDRATAPSPVQTDVVEVVANGDHTCARLSDGSGSCWGDNDDGQLGDGTVVQRDVPTFAVGSLVGIATGVAHTCAMSADMTVACWGRDTTGELGDGSHVQLGPQNTALPAGASGLAVGAFHACAITGTDNRVYCWGDDHQGQLGDGAPQLVSSTPSDTGLTGVAAIAAGVSHTCAVRSDQSLWCWGNNADGELGDGTHTSRSQPVMTTIAATAVAAGDGFTCVITPTSTVQCFGRNDLGQLATGATIPALASISASYDHICGVTATGAIVCWGSNSHGQIGNGGVGAMAGPGGPMGTYLQVAAGGHHTCAIPSPPTDAMCWGGNELDQLGAFQLSDSYSPTRPGVGLGVGTLVVGTGRAHTCVSGSDNGHGFPWTECFGENIDGQDGIEFRHTVFPMLPASSDYATVMGGGDAFTCGLVGTSVKCWGDNSRGQLGIGSYSRSTSPLEIVISN